MTFPKTTLAEDDEFLQGLLSEMLPTVLKQRSPPRDTPVTVSTPLKPALKPKTPTSEVKRLLDGIDEWDWDNDIDDNMQTSSQGSAISRLPERVSPPLDISKRDTELTTRCIVDAVQQENLARFEKTLVVHVDNPSGADKRHVILKGDWSTTDIRIGDICNIIGNFEQSPGENIKYEITLSSQHNLLILHPDLLIPVTSIAKAVDCLRRPIISTLLPSNIDVTPSLVWGNMLHEIMQVCLSEGRWDDQWIEEKTNEVVTKDIASLVRLDINVEVAKMEIKKRAIGLQGFSNRFIGDAPKSNASLSDSHGSPDDSTLLAICGLHETEEDILSPSYGLKGKLDASVQVVLEETKGVSKGKKKVSMPFEIKTGLRRGIVEHRAQTMLYTVLMAERYGTEVPNGLLYYTHSDEVIRVKAARNELRALIQNRNAIAAYTMRRSSRDEVVSKEDFLPPTEDSEHKCGRCYVSDGCMLYRKAVEEIEDTSSEIAELYENKTGHLTSNQCSYFKEWENLISLEEQEIIRFRKELWTMGATEREKKGRCFANMIIESRRDPAPSNSAKIHQHTYTFTRKIQVGSDSLKQVNSLLNGQMSKGDPVTISIEPHLLSLSRGFVLELSTQRVTVGLDRAIDVDRLVGRSREKDNINAADVVFRIDKDELSAGIGRIRNNLAQLFYRGGDQRRLKSVVDLQAPLFDDLIFEREFNNAPKELLNVDQRRAMAKVLAAQDYTIILGMPGTGKTTTIAEIIKELVKRGKSVLLSSYTHSAVDTILLKLQDVDFEVLRLGNADKVHPDILKMTLGAKPVPTSVEQLERQLLSPPVVATTCLSIDHTLFSRRSFDVCIVDEASQITLPTCLGPLRFADRFVLVGDHFQLPPLVKSHRAKKGGMDVSLFRRLSEAHPNSVVELTRQYRMNNDIMKVSNTLIYGDRLRCGDEKVAQRELTLRNKSKLQKMHLTLGIPCNGKTCWLQELCEAKRRVVFVNTDPLLAKESRVSDLVQNEVEANLVHQFVNTLIDCGVEDSQVGVLSLYRQQVKLLSNLLESHKKLEVLTADRSQGRDKDCIVISMVRSNDSGLVGELMKDWRRLNVSFTRARSKLVIFGSRKTLGGAPMLKEFFELMDAQEWIYNLPNSAHLSHSVSKKRPVSAIEKENVAPSRKRTKVEKSTLGTSAILRGRPMLRDLLNNQNVSAL